MKKVFLFAYYTLIITVISCAPAKYDIKQGNLAKFYIVASWYGPEFHGRPTSSGETFDMYAKTCAHKDYPFGTRLKVTNINNNKSTECIVNDRGPFIEGRDIDLSYAVAREIGIVGTGTGRVAIEVAGRDSSYIKKVKVISGDKNGPFAIQIGSFTENENAKRLKAALELKYKNVYIQEANIKGVLFYRIRIGNFDDISGAMPVAKRLAQEGYSAIVLKADVQI